MKDKVDYSLYECPYVHLKKDFGHALHSPDGYENVYGVWCACGFCGPAFYLEPDELGLKLKVDKNKKQYHIHYKDEHVASMKMLPKDFYDFFWWISSTFCVNDEDLEWSSGELIK